MVDAGVELLAEGGWPAVTTRSVAERAGANLGLIHYHWGGLPQLKQAIARRAGELIFGPLTIQLLESAGVDEVLDQLPAMVSPPTDATMTRLTVELIAGAVRDPQLGDVLRESLAEARRELSGWLETHLPGAPDGTATLLIALLDGLFLHHMLDPEMGSEEAIDALSRFTAHAPALAQAGPLPQAAPAAERDDRGPEPPEDSPDGTGSPDAPGGPDAGPGGPPGRRT
ncbi:TetR/AcrR family transcriptional regulator [Streptomyces sp. JJ36]|uniref:TetR/AcrR family transcriptional regulator n=1 Tax=Streptomyces sp. JJ36 TaxID=2736645 RepID=UPI001F259A89|nr:TetR/AcrR family transcriptional regulator [Streptomyces sp. JJ36]